MRHFGLLFIFCFCFIHAGGQQAVSRPLFSSDTTSIKDGDKHYCFYIWVRDGQLSMGNLKFGIMDVGTLVSQGQRIEWRLADGDPFVIITPVTKWKSLKGHRTPTDSMEGNLLAIKGVWCGRLYSEIDTAIDANLPGAATLARRLADESWRYHYPKRKK